MKQKLIFLICAVLFFAATSAKLQIANAQTVWSGNTDTQWYDDFPNLNDYFLSTAEQVAGLAELVNNGNTFAGRTINLTANILLNDTTNWQSWDGTTTGLNHWTPIGRSNPSGRNFGGTFDGAGHTICGMFINITTYITYVNDNVGFFGYVTGDVTIRNVGIKASFIRAGAYPSASCGYVGALVGNMQANNYSQGDANIINCFNEGTVTGYAAYIGGLVGYIMGNVQDCYNKGNVGGIGTGSSSSRGGLIGISNGYITNCYNTGSVSGSNCYRIGGLSGYHDIFQAKDSYNSGNVSSYITSGNTSTNVSALGGLFGGVSVSSGYGGVINCYNTGNVTDGGGGTSHYGSVGGFAGSAYGPITDCHNSGTVIGLGNDTGGFAGYGSPTMINCSNSGAVSGIDKVGGLIGQGSSAAFDSHNSGTVYGRNDVGGLFGRSTGAYNGAVDHCYNSGAVTGTGDNIGGLVGYYYQSTPLIIRNSFNKGSVTGTAHNGYQAGSEYVGGIIGYADISGVFNLSNSYNIGNISASGYIGGLAGFTESTTIINCYNAGGVSGYEYLGGMTGWKEGGSITYSYWRTDGPNGMTYGVGHGTFNTNAQGKTTQELKSEVFVDLLNTRTRTMNVADVTHPYYYWAQDTQNNNLGYPVYGDASINFVPNGEGVSTITPGYEVLPNGGTASFLPEPEREGYVFAGWNTKPDATGDEFTTETEVYGHTSVYAFWRRIIYITNNPDFSMTYNGSAVIDPVSQYNWGYITYDNYEQPYTSVSVIATSAIFDDKNVGTNKNITVTYELTGDHAWRYIIEPHIFTNTTINALTLTHNINIPNKIYDGTYNVEFTGGLTNVIEDDDLVLNVVFKSGSINVGYTTVTAEVWEIIGNDALNYILPDFNQQSLYINALTLTHDITVVPVKVYDGTNIAEYTGGLTNIVVGDEDGVSLHPDFYLYYSYGSHVQTDGPIYAGNWNIVGTKATNYTLPSWVTQTASIISAPSVITINSHPVSLTNVTEGCISESLSVSASVTENDTMSYQWYENSSNSNEGGTAISGANNASFAIPTNITASDSPYYYFCEVRATGAVSVRSNVATVNVLAPVITINTQPATITRVTEGSISGSFYVLATIPCSTPSYQWFSNTTNSNVGGTEISGETSESFTIPTNLTAANSPYYYFCEISATGATSVRSSVAEVIVNEVGSDEYFIVNPIAQPKDYHIIIQWGNPTYSGNGGSTNDNYNIPKAITGYTVYRLQSGQPESAWTLLSGNVEARSYADNQWSSLSNGTYQYAVKINYADGSKSPASLSNILDKQNSKSSLQEEDNFEIPILSENTENITLYPNPTGGKFSVFSFQFSDVGAYNIHPIEIFDVTGRLVHR